MTWTEIHSLERQAAQELTEVIRAAEIAFEEVLVHEGTLNAREALRATSECDQAQQAKTELCK